MPWVPWCTCAASLLLATLACSTAGSPEESAEAPREEHSEPAVDHEEDSPLDVEDSPEHSPGVDDLLVTGTWTGKVTSPEATPVTVRFTIEEGVSSGEADSPQSVAITGRTYFGDPDSGEFLPEAPLLGSRAGSHASWLTEGDLVISGTFDAGSFIGTLEFPAEEDEAGVAHPPHLTTLTLQR